MATYSSIRWLRVISFLLLAGLAAACLPPLTPVPPSSPTPYAAKPRAVVPKTFPTRKIEFLSTPTPGPTPTPTPRPRAQADTDLAMRLTQQGEALFVKSDLAGAEAAFIEALAADPGYLPAHLGLTRTYLYQPQYWQQALAAAQAAAALAPDDATVLAYLAWAQQMAHLFDEARSTAMRAVTQGPGNPLAHAALADVLISVYEVDLALEHARRAVELDEQSAVAWATLGYAEFTFHNWDAARAAYDRAVELEPTFFAWRMARATHEFDTTGDILGARAIAQPALEAQPNHAVSLFFLVDVATETHDWEAAEAACSQLMGLDQPHTPYPDPYTCMATVMLRQERYREAEHYQALAEARATPNRRDISLIRMRLYLDYDQCQKAWTLAEDWLNERPYSIQAMRMIGLSYLCESDYEQAIAYFRQAYEASPRSVDSARLLALAYAQNDQASEAIAVLNQIASFATEDPTYYQALYEVNMHLTKWGEALRAAQRWQALRPHDTAPRVSMAMAHLALGNLATARSTAENAMADGEQSATLYAILGETMRRMDELEKAEEYLVRAVTQNEHHYLARDLLARLYISQNRCEDALPHLRWLLEHTTDKEEVSALARTIRMCELQVAPRPTPPPAEVLDDITTVREATARVRAASAEPVRVEVTTVDEQRVLLVAYSTSLEASSEEFAELERSLAKELARLLPRIASQPEMLALLSGSGGRAQNLILVSTEAAALWVNGELTDEEFEETWIRQTASRSGQGEIQGP